jgi:hypothetical protein
MDQEPKTRAARPRVNVQGKAVVERCGECAACQEWMLLASSAPPCTYLLVMMPDGSVQHAGTERKAFRAIQRWCAENMDEGAFNVATVEWRQGTCPPPVLRRGTKR